MTTPRIAHQAIGSHWRLRVAYAAAAGIAVCLGLASRRYPTLQPKFVATYAGDAIWAAMVFCGFSMLFVRRPLEWRATVALAFCYAIECSQTYHAPWIDNVRQTTLGGLVLGRGFLANDLLCYTAGLVIAAGIDAAVRRRPPHRTTTSA